MPEKDIVRVTITGADDSPEGNRTLDVVYSDDVEVSYPITEEQAFTFKDILADWVAGLNTQPLEEETEA